MSIETETDLTELLNLGLNGDAQAGARAFSLIYDQLKRTAAKQLGSNRGSDTLSATALVNETYLKLVSGARLALNDRAHFFSLTARAMKQLLIDHQRSKSCDKHGGGLRRVELDEHLLDATDNEFDYLDLDRALARLEGIDERAARVVELHFFVGLNFMEIAELLAVSDKTVRRDWNSARAYLLLQASA
jgi:RNA polymerase sigma factor (TIGR02999 family)